MGTYLRQVFAAKQPQDRTGIRAAVVEAGQKRVRPAMMTTATTVIALLPVLTSTGKGSDIMVPMAIPTVGGYAHSGDDHVRRAGAVLLVEREELEATGDYQKSISQMKTYFNISSYRQRVAIVLLLLSGGVQAQRASPIDQYLTVAGENNPRLQSLFDEYLATLEEIPQAGALPDPQLTFATFVQPVETRVGGAASQRFSKPAIPLVRDAQCAGMGSSQTS